MAVLLPVVHSPFVDAKTGLVNRDWYLALLTLNQSIPVTIVTSVNITGNNGITVTSSGTTSAAVVTLGIGNLTCANAQIAGTVTAADVVVAASVLSANIRATGTVTAANVRAIGMLATGTVTSANERTGGIIATGTITSANVLIGASLYPPTETAGFQVAAALYAGTGVPNNANGNNGDYYLRSDGAAVSHIYFKTAGAWAGII